MRIEHRRQQLVGANLGVESSHQAVDHGLGDPGPLGNPGRSSLSPLCRCHADLLK
jgi:hypothetical protein